MTLLLHNPQLVRALPPVAPPASLLPTTALFVQRTLHVAASAYYGTDAGDFPVWAFVPCRAAVDAWGGLSSVTPPGLVGMHGSGEIYNGSNRDAQMITIGSLAQKLGFNDPNNQKGAGAAASTPDQTWPAVTVFPQNVNQWTGTGGADGGARARRLGYQLISAALDAIIAEFNVDPTRQFLTGLSYGAIMGWQYCYSNPTRLAGFISAAGYMEHNLSEGVPGLVLTPNTTAQAAAVIAPVVKDMNLWQFNSVNDASVTPALYNPTTTELTNAGASHWAFTEYGAGLFYDHPSTWTHAYNDANGLWTAVFSKHL
jgi:predicted esterase